MSYSIFQENLVVTRHLGELQVIHGVQSTHGVDIYSPHTQERPNERPSSLCDTGTATESYLLPSSCHRVTEEWEIIQDPGLYSMFLLPTHLFLQALLLTCKICGETSEWRQNLEKESKMKPRQLKQTEPLTAASFSPSLASTLPVLQQWETLIHELVLVPTRPNSLFPDRNSSEWGPVIPLISGFGLLTHAG